MSLKLAGKKVKFKDVDSEGNEITIKGTIAKCEDILLPVAIETKDAQGEKIIEFERIPLVRLEEDK